MDKIDFSDVLEATFTGIIEIIYFYIITIPLFLIKPLEIWDRIYNEASNSKSDFDFRNVGLSQPTMFFAISLIIFIYIMKILFEMNYLNYEELEINKELQPIVFKLINSITNIYEFNVTILIIILLIINLVFSIFYWNLFSQMNNINKNTFVNIYIKFFDKIALKITNKHIKFDINLILEYYKAIFSKIFKIRLKKRQENPFLINWTDIHSIHRFIAISNFISGISILLLIIPFIILIKNTNSIFVPFFPPAIAITVFYVFFPAWFMSYYSINND